MSNIELLEKTLPAAPLKLIAMESCRELGQKVNDYIVSFRENTINEVSESSLYVNYKSNNYLVDCCCPRFGTGEAKGLLKETIRGTDLFIMTDVCNHNLTYTVNGHLNHMSPDDHKVIFIGDKIRNGAKQRFHKLVRRIEAVKSA